MTKKSICHITSVHKRYDSRIFDKECVGLANNGFGVTLIVADQGADVETRQRVKIINVNTNKSPIGRIKRALKIPKEIEKKVDKINPGIVHFHDPELIPLALRLKRKGYRVIGDFHEDIPLQILTKPYLNQFFKRIISGLFKVYQNSAIKKLDAVIAATPTIKHKLAPSSYLIETIFNYPIFHHTQPDTPSIEKQGVAYIGGITRERGFYHICEAAKIAGTKLTLAGNFHSSIQQAKEEIKLFTPFVTYVGFLNHEGVTELLSKSIAGLVTLLPLQSYVDAYPIKLFEYMRAGIPVIASNFPLWKEIIEENKCGFCVDPENPQEIAEAINFLSKHPDKAQEMGANGRKAVEEKYNWQSEEKKLITLYHNLL